MTHRGVAASSTFRDGMAARAAALTEPAATGAACDQPGDARARAAAARVPRARASAAARSACCRRCCCRPTACRHVHGGRDQCVAPRIARRAQRALATYDPRGAPRRPTTASISSSTPSARASTRTAALAAVKPGGVVVHVGLHGLGERDRHAQAHARGDHADRHAIRTRRPTCARRRSRCTKRAFGDLAWVEERPLADGAAASAICTKAAAPRPRSCCVRDARRPSALRRRMSDIVFDGVSRVFQRDGQIVPRARQTSPSRCATASSSRSSGRRDAARRRACGWPPGSSSRRRAPSASAARPVTRPGPGPRRRVPAVRAVPLEDRAREHRLRPAQQGRARAGAPRAHRAPGRADGTAGLRVGVSASALGRHAAARRHRAQLCARSRTCC